MDRREFFKLTGAALALEALGDVERLFASTPHYAIVRTPHADLRTGPSRSAGLATQALMGATLIVDDVVGDLYAVRALPQKYPGYVSREAVLPLSDTEGYLEEGPVAMAALKSVAVLEKPGGRAIAQVHGGTRLAHTGSHGTLHGVRLPNGREGVIERWARVFPNPQLPLKGRDEIVRDAEHIVDTYKTPYLWGGATPQGWDCSGFTMWLFAYNGHDIPRDAWQQYARESGVTYRSNREPPSDDSLIERVSGLEPGDLAFFGKSERKIDHVGLIGARGELLHSALETRGLARSRLRNDPEFGNYFRDRFIGGRRYFTPGQLRRYL